MLQQKLTEDLKAAMRARDDVRLRTIRSIRAALQEREIELREGGTATLTDEQELSVLQKQAKQRRDAIDQFRNVGRDDLAAREAEELELIETYLPSQLTDAELRSAVQGVVAETGATSMKDMGRVMGLAMERVRGRADGRRVQEAVRGVLGSGA